MPRPPGFHEKTRQCEAARRSLPRALRAPPRASPVPPEVSFHNASLATSRPLPSVARARLQLKGVTAKQQEFTSAQPQQQPLRPLSADASLAPPHFRGGRGCCEVGPARASLRKLSEARRDSRTPEPGSVCSRDRRSCRRRGALQVASVCRPVTILTGVFFTPEDRSAL